MNGLCHDCYHSNVETFFSKKSGMPVCKDCVVDEYCGVKS